jgi:hypothetical protein
MDARTVTPRAARDVLKDPVVAARIGRLIDAGATGVADFLLTNADHSEGSAAPSSPLASATASSPSDTHVPHLTHVAHELRPLPWRHWIMNLLLISHYINEAGRSLMGGLDLVALVQPLLYSPPTLCRWFCCCGRRGGLPPYRRLYNSFVRWDEKDSVLVGTPKGSGEFSFLRQTQLYHSVFFFALFMVDAIVILAFPGDGARPSSYVLASGVNIADLGAGIWGLICGFITLILVFIGLVATSPPIDGARPGSLPLLLPRLLQASAPQFMISYAWRGGMLPLARALGEVLPDSWVDVRSLISGQVITSETVRTAAHARVTVLLLTPEYLQSRNCAGELLAAVALRRNKGSPGACHKTVALLERKYLDVEATEGNATDEENDGAAAGSVGRTASAPRYVPAGALAPRLREARGLLEGAGYSVVPRNPPLDWVAIRAVLEEAGCDIVDNVDALFIHLQSHAVTTPDAADTAICRRWWAQYASSVVSSGAAASVSSDVRVPWNVLGSEKQRARRALPQPLCSRLGRALCKRRPHTRIGPCRWREASITTGMGGAWISADGVEPPQPHADITFRLVMGVYIAIGIIEVAGVVFGSFATEDDAESSAAVRLALFF